MPLNLLLLLLFVVVVVGGGSGCGGGGGGGHHGRIPSAPVNPRREENKRERERNIQLYIKLLIFPNFGA